MLNVVEGDVLDARILFLDDADQPVLPKPGYPIATLYNSTKLIVGQQFGSATTNVGEWNAQLAIPDMGLDEPIEFKLLWKMKSRDNVLYKDRDIIRIEPKTDVRTGDVVSVFNVDLKSSFSLPVVIKGPDIAQSSYSIFNGNTLLAHDIPLTDSLVIIRPGIDRTVVQIPLTVPQARLEPYLVMFKVGLGTADTRTYTFKLYAVTPAIIGAMGTLEDYINKSRIENVIPELRYTDSDLLGYLQRGLALFNSYPPALTAFNGTDMQGMIQDAWLVCSTYYALGAQLQAEGSLAFDFSGQSVTLNVDRTPTIESALGRMESLIDSTVKPMKKLLTKAGVLGGSGSQGRGFIDGSRSIGSVTIANSPMSRIPVPGGNSWLQIFRR